jgi:hypothetical protein
MVFSDPGVGKTTLATTMLNSETGGPMLFVNFDEEVRSIQDRNDIMVWPGVKQGGKVGTWLKAESFLSKLSMMKHPFKHIVFDTLNSAYDKFVLPPIAEEMGPRADGRQLYGKANDQLLLVVRTWTAIAREQGINVVFLCHAEEKEVKTSGESSVIYKRPAVTPGVIKGMYQLVSTIGYLEPSRMNRPRKLILAPSARIVAKNHQPRSGSQIPNEITDPDLGKLIDHFSGIRPYPTKKKEDA